MYFWYLCCDFTNDIFTTYFHIYFSVISPLPYKNVKNKKKHVHLPVLVSYDISFFSCNYVTILQLHHIIICTSTK